MTDNQSIARHYGFGDIMDRVRAGLKAAGVDLQSLSVDDLAVIDAFHTRGRQSTLELAELSGAGTFAPAARILDLGCGLGGSARFLAERYGCHVTGVDLTADYIDAARQLTRLVQLEDRVTYLVADAVALPFDEESFDVVWTEHAQMNIPDKTQFYSEVARVLKPGGQLLFHDIFAGSKTDPTFPLPWADQKSISWLISEEQARQAMQDTGLSITHWRNKIDESLEFFGKVLNRVETQGFPPLGIHLLMGDSAKQKIENYLQSMSGGHLSIALGSANLSA